MIFEDPSSKRWKLTIAVFACIVIIAVILIVKIREEAFNLRKI